MEIEENTKMNMEAKMGREKGLEECENEEVKMKRK